MSSSSVDIPTMKETKGRKEWRLKAEWRLEGQLHNEDGPAVESKTCKQWWLNGKCHREDGPSIEWWTGYKEWYLYGEKISQEEHSSQTTLVKRAV